MSTRPFDPDSHQLSPLHGSDRVWVETNCYVDIWIELIHHLGLPPQPAGLCALSGDWIGREWSFLKYQTDDLRRLYGIDVAEINLWRPVEEHVLDHLDVGDLVTVESDAWYLPDTAGVSYQEAHVKTTIVPVALDVEGRTMTYLHNAGMYTLSGEDFEGALARPGAQSCAPQPYLELVRLHRVNRDLATLPLRARELAQDHLSRRPADNPVARLATYVQSALPDLATRGMSYFHDFSFAVSRQLGLTGQNASDGLGWLAEHDATLTAGQRDELIGAATEFDQVSQIAKKLQFAVARIAAGRQRDVRPLLDELVTHWEAGMGAAGRALP